ncbi:hypothetical protein BDV12DRAFT_183738 [Aspergillus spectabilis]
MLETRTLDVAIVGGGLAGAPRCPCHCEKHNVRIYERMSTPVEFDGARVGSLSVGATRVYSKEGELMLDKQNNYAEQYGAEWLLQHRADLRTEFLRLATDEAITLASGEEVTADLIPDGIKSAILPHVVGDAALSTARPSGLSVFRFTLEASSIKHALGHIPELLQPHKPACLKMVRRVSVSELPTSEFHCIVADTSLKGATTGSRSAAGDRDELLSLVKDFPPWDLEFLRLAKNIKLWQLRDHDPLPTYNRGRALLIRNAAYGMTPHQGPGGAQAVEDAEAFCLFPQPDISRDDVPRLLKDIDDARRPRASAIQSNNRKPNVNWAYPGIVTELARVRSGQDINGLGRSTAA